MADSTPNFNFTIPTPGGDDNSWGGMLNGNWTDLDTILKTMQDQLTAVAAAAEARKIPIGGLYLTTIAENPNTTLGYGTWAPHAAGRALVGVGNNGESSWPVDQTRGSETHKLVAGELPIHTHKVNPPATDTTQAGEHSHTLQHNLDSATAGGFVSGNDGPVQVNNTTAVRPAGNHTHNVDIPEFDSGAVGADTPHNNVQPSIAVFVWKRTS